MRDGVGERHDRRIDLRVGDARSRWLCFNFSQCRRVGTDSQPGLVLFPGGRKPGVMCSFRSRAAARYQFGWLWSEQKQQVILSLLFVAVDRPVFVTPDGIDGVHHLARASVWAGAHKPAPASSRRRLDARAAWRAGPGLPGRDRRAGRAVGAAAAACSLCPVCPPSPAPTPPNNMFNLYIVGRADAGGQVFLQIYNVQFEPGGVGFPGPRSRGHPGDPPSRAARNRL